MIDQIKGTIELADQTIEFDGTKDGNKIASELMAKLVHEANANAELHKPIGSVKIPIGFKKVSLTLNDGKQEKVFNSGQGLIEDLVDSNILPKSCSALYTVKEMIMDTKDQRNTIEILAIKGGEVESTGARFSMSKKTGVLNYEVLEVLDDVDVTTELVEYETENQSSIIEFLKGVISDPTCKIEGLLAKVNVEDSHYEVKCSDVQSVSGLLSGVHTQVTQDIEGYVDSIKVELNNLLSTGCNLHIVKGHIKVRYPKTEEQESTIYDYYFNKGCIKVVSEDGGEKEVRDINIYDFAVELQQHNKMIQSLGKDKDTGIFIQPCPEVLWLTDQENINSIIVKDIEGLTTYQNPGKLIGAIRNSVEESFNESMLDKVEQMTTIVEKFLDLKQDIEEKMQYWVKDISRLLPDLDKEEMEVKQEIEVKEEQTV